jgi:hypothetical protein
MSGYQPQESNMNTEYKVRFSQEMPHVIIPSSISCGWEGTLQHSLLTIYDSTPAQEACIESILQNQSNVVSFSRVPRKIQGDVADGVRYTRKTDALREARKQGKDVVIRENLTGRGNVYFVASEDEYVAS